MIGNSHAFKKGLLAVLVLASFAGYSLQTRSEQKEATVVTSSALAPATTSAGTTSSGTGSGASGTAQTVYRDGSYTGSVADAFYGNIQVKAIVSGGKLADVVFLQSPGDRRESVQINQQAMPLLKQEAISIQSARVDGVSGATDTSQAFVESLTVALNQAKA